jgi:hypothetical protein
MSDFGSVGLILDFYCGGNYILMFFDLTEKGDASNAWGFVSRF